MTPFGRLRARKPPPAPQAWGLHARRMAPSGNSRRVFAGLWQAVWRYRGRTLLALAPAAKILYGSDSSVIPEHLWLGALLGRRSLGTVLGELVDAGMLSTSAALDAAEMMLNGAALTPPALAKHWAELGPTCRSDPTGDTGDRSLELMRQMTKERGLGAKSETPTCPTRRL